jgi:hypothetical protein
MAIDEVAKEYEKFINVSKGGNEHERREKKKSEKR